jgi:hypothetical protein
MTHTRTDIVATATHHAALPWPRQEQEHMVQRVRAEFLEMPGMRITEWQVQRLCGVSTAVCRGVLDQLVAAHFLIVDTKGAYRRYLL